MPSRSKDAFNRFAEQKYKIAAKEPKKKSEPETTLEMKNEGKPDAKKVEKKEEINITMSKADEPQTTVTNVETKIEEKSENQTVNTNVKKEKKLPGRKVSVGDGAKNRIVVLLDDETNEQFKKYCEENRYASSELIRLLIREKLGMK